MSALDIVRDLFRSFLAKLRQLSGAAPAEAHGGLGFRALPHLSTTDVADALQIARARILRYLGRRGVIRVGDDALSVDDELCERDPALARLAHAAVSGLAPAGPELRLRPVELAFEGRPGVLITAPLSVREHGFSLHAATRAGAADPKGREALLKYILRPPVATERVVAGPDGLVRVVLKKPVQRRRRHHRRRPGPALAALPARRDRAATAVSHRALCRRPLIAREVATARRPGAPAGRTGPRPE
jgi:hypothetical protein